MGDILLFGSESSGLPAELLEPFRGQTLRVPMREQVRSLNLSATAAIVMYEAVRQIRPLIN
jgi:tRNA (cytidine/uridine-2'-O-)-methyltransferase